MSYLSPHCLVPLTSSTLRKINHCHPKKSKFCNHYSTKASSNSSENKYSSGKIPVNQLQQRKNPCDASIAVIGHGLKRPQVPGPKRWDQNTQNLGSGTQNKRLKTQDWRPEDPRPQDFGIEDPQDLGPRTQDPGIWDLRTQEPGPRTKHLETQNSTSLF